MNVLPKREGAELALILFLMALAPRLWVAKVLAGEAVWDGHYYDIAAKSLASGFGYGEWIAGGATWQPWCHYPVGYSAFLAPFYRVFGTHVAPTVGAFVGALLAPLSYGAARAALSERRARVCGVLVALHPGLILYSGLVMAEPLAAMLTMASLLLAGRAKTIRGLFAASLVLGLSALVRPQGLLLFPALAWVGAKAFGQTSRRAIPLVLLMVFGTLLPIAPWTVRNCLTMDGCALVSTNAGWNLAIGSLPRATGRFETLRAADGCSDVRGQVDQDRCWLRVGLAQVAEDPVRWLALIPKKLSYTFDHESFAVEYLHLARPDQWPDPLRTRVRQGTTWFHRGLLVLAALGGLASLRPSRVRAALSWATALFSAWVFGRFLFEKEASLAWLALLLSVVPWVIQGEKRVFRLGAAVIGTTALAHAVFFGEDRYHLVTVPVLALFASAITWRVFVPSSLREPESEKTLAEAQ